MFVEERQAIIIDLLQEHGKVRVKDLSARFQVTEDLIRKDLTSLEEKGLLKKAYGGAVLERINIHRESVVQRKGTHLEEKRRIAKKAVSLLTDNMVVFLDISTVTLEIAIALAKKPKRITIVTNMFAIVQILAPIEPITFIFVGGELDYGRDGCVGVLTNEMIRSFRFDVAFMGVVGLDVYDNGVHTYMPNDGLTKKEVLRHSKASYLVCEDGKFAQSGSYKYANITDCHGIITNKEPSKEVAKQLQTLEVPLHIA